MPGSTQFHLQSVLGSVYDGISNVVFTPDSSSIISPIAARCSVFPLASTVPSAAAQDGSAPSAQDAVFATTTRTFDFEMKHAITRLALSPPLGPHSNTHLLLAADKEGRATLVSFRATASVPDSIGGLGSTSTAALGRESILAQISFKAPLRDAQFSPDARYLAVTHNNHIQVWKTPGSAAVDAEGNPTIGIIAPSFTPFELHRVYTGHFEDVLSITWSKNSDMFLTTSKDMTFRLYSLNPVLVPLREPVPDPKYPGGVRHWRKFKPKTFSGHKSAVVGAFFSADETEIYTVSRDGACFVWRAKEEEEDSDEGEDEDLDEEELPHRTTTTIRNPEELPRLGEKFPPAPKLATTRWGVSERFYYFRANEEVRSVDYHAGSGLLLTAFNSGVFTLHTMPDFSKVHELSISNASLNTAQLSPTGDWLALGSGSTGQLMVWEWASSNYILRQQSHHLGMMNSMAYSSDGTTIVTGGADGRLKLWNTSTGLATVTFEQHTAEVMALEFAKRGGQVLFSASLDGTVRAWDLIRYRNFRTFVTPDPVQFACLAVEPSGEVVVAGSQDQFEIYMWSVQTGKLIETWGGHTGPVSGLAFAPDGRGTLLSVSWDRTLKIWEVFRDGNQTETIQLNSEAMAVAFRPDSIECCVATLDGNLSFYDTKLVTQTGVIEARRDIARGRRRGDKVAAHSNKGDNCFTSITYSADGESILASGNSNWICLYDVREKVLLKRWQITGNVDFDGLQVRLDSRKLTEAGHVDLLDVEEQDELTGTQKRDRSLPGVQSGDRSKRSTPPLSRSTCIRFDPTGRNWSATTTSGLLIYSLDAARSAAQFDPFDLDLDLTPQGIREAAQDGEHLMALIGALRLGERGLLAEMYERIPAHEIELVARQVPTLYVVPLLRLIAARMHPRANSPHVEYHLRWLSALMTAHGKSLRGRTATSVAPVLREVQASLNELRANVKRVSEDNQHALLYTWGAIQPTAL